MRFLLYLICFLNINIITKLFVNCGDFALDPKRKGNGLNLNELRSLQKMFNGITVHGKYVDLSDDVKELIDKMSTKYIRANLHYDVGKTLKLLPHEYHLNYVRILASLLFPIIDDEVRLRLVDDVVKQLEGHRVLQEELVELYASLRSRIHLIKAKGFDSLL